ncbi:carbon-nitrogen hydrolase family protein [Brevibacterium aurantiacum]|uniref:Carbon-nitrogen hydrolase family protein n=1 Tax=Brevibacterium aurantiacum TaxID=273384 RepID=A0A556CFV6_BREAU|nr:carbon-nitrogen hydrolase family protein [Brevibacterium aurantiacum]TSI15928.1 carbon-nitrogen hydrolase family protein [Brevibacterium aurantiacum]
MPQRELSVGLAQRAPLHGPNALARLHADVERTLARHPEIDMLVYPELHLQGVDHLPNDEQPAALSLMAMPLDDPFVARIGDVAAAFGIWLCPGSIGESTSTDAQHNTQLLFSPDGTLAASYRKMFPWRPFEPHLPGTEFVVAPIDGHGVLGLSNCYDAWFPEHSRHLAWMGADAIINIVKTTSQDREQELVLARANAIVNQVYMLSVNCAEPVGRGHSIAVGPEGQVLAEAGAGEDTLVVRVDSGQIQRVRAQGTAGTNRIWSQFTPEDAPIPLPLYGGRIDPEQWSPRYRGHN